MSELRIYVEGSSYEIFTYANSTADETISFATLLNRADNNGYKPVDTINTLLNNGYEYTTDNTYGHYFRFWNGSQSLFDTVWQNVTLKANAWWDAEIYMGPAAITVTLSFDSNGGSPPFSSVTETDTPSSSGYINVRIPPNYIPSKSGYSFTGWKIGSNVFDAGDYVGLNTNATAVAQWQRELVTIQLTTTSTSDTITATVANPGSMPSDFDHYFWQIDSTDAGTDTTGTHEFTGLTKGNTYTIKCGGYNSSNEQIAYGTKQATTTSSNIWIYTSSGWKLATPYVYTSSGWKEAQAYIYTSSGWTPC